MVQESESLRIFVSKKGLIRDCPMDVCMRDLWQKVDVGKKTCIESTTRFLRASCFEETTCSVPGTWGRMYDIVPWSTIGM
jgi:hypothetical protein